MKVKLYLALLSLSLIGQARASETLSQLISDARVLAVDPAGTRQRFSDTQITQLLNVAQRQSDSNNHCIQASLNFSLTPGVTYYNLPANFLNLTRVTIGGKWLSQMTPAGLDGRSRGWELASGYPSYYFINFSSRTQIGFAPWPAASTDTDTIKAEFNIQATDLVNSTDQPFNGIPELQDYHHMLAYYAASVMDAIDGLTNQSQLYMGIFQNMNKEFDAHCIDNPAYLPSAAGAR